MTVYPLELEWGLKDSFIAYLEALPDGLIEEHNGATRRDGVFVLPGRQQAGDDNFAFTGTMRFYGHHGVLDVTLDNFSLERSGNRAVVYAEVSGVRIPVAQLSRVEAGDRTVLHSESVTLTDDGAAVLGGVYSPGASLAPLTIRSTH
ncbi:HtaA domain-containing protein [Pseudarthrobacter sp. NPDC058329]|uniref:HtaA domain-containing protein n=1 Tax=Pseudarthrobacter sp. NPDC058329 TaxID=3346448 RepID=UPI0036D7CA2A